MALRLHDIVLLFLASLCCMNVVKSELLRDVCGPGWDAPSQQPKWCYKFVFDASVNFDWYLARHYCKQQNSELLVIDDDDEADWLMEVFTSISNSRSRLTGFHSADSEATGWHVDAHKSLYCANQRPCWRNGKPLDSLDSLNLINGLDSKHCDSLLLINTPSCYVVYAKEDEMDALNVDCSTSRMHTGIVCKKAARAAPVADTSLQLCSHVDAQSLSCPTGWLKPTSELTAAPYCYKFVSFGAMSWDSAYSQCKAEKAELLYLENSHETRWVVGTATSLLRVDVASQRYAVNAHVLLYSYGVWSFAGGMPVHLVSLYRDEELLKSSMVCGNEYCAELISDAGSNGFHVNFIPCSTTNDWNLGYICKKPVCVVPYKSSQNVTFKADYRNAEL